MSSVLVMHVETNPGRSWAVERGFDLKSLASRRIVAMGGLSATREERVIAPAVPVASSVGAGDAMVAGIVLSLVRGRSLSQAVRFGVAACAAAVMNPGTELCRREDAERLYDQTAPAEI